MKLQVLNKVISKVGPKVGKVVLKCKKHSPEILLGVGIAAGVGCVIVACKATYDHLGEVVADHITEMEEINDTTVDETGKPIDMDAAKAKVYRKMVVKRCALTTGEIIKLYLPAAALGAVSVAAILGSHHIMLGRIAGLTAAYTAVDEAFKEYRARVVEKYGEEEDFNLRYGVEEKEVTVQKENEDGVVEEVNEKIKTAHIDKYSMYAKFFDQSCKAWEKNPEYNLLYLTAQQEYFNTLLSSRGYVFLNEVYDALGIERTSYGQVVGWLKGVGDGYIDFGIYNNEEATRRFVNGLEPVILLDFNVDGVIWDKI